MESKAAHSDQQFVKLVYRKLTKRYQDKYFVDICSEGRSKRLRTKVENLVCC